MVLTAIINNKGDIGAVLKELSSSANLRAIAASIITAGVSHGLDAGVFQQAGLGNVDNTFQNFTQNLATNAIRGTITSTIRAAIEGGDIGDAVLSSLQSVGVNTVLSAVQTSIGDLTDGVGANDLPLANILAHSIAGGLAAEALGESFASGASAAFASAVAANSGLFDDLFVGDTAEDRAQKIGTIAQLIGGTASFLASSGRDAGAVNQGASIAQSATLNNYLTHAELRKYEEEYEGCAGNLICKLRLQYAYEQISNQNTNLLKACGTDNSCIARHLYEISKAAEVSRNFKLIGVNERHGTLFSSSAHELYQTADFRRAISVYRANNDLQLVCPGFESGCVNTQLAISYAKFGLNTAADFTPGIGELKAFYDAYKSGSYLDYAAAVLGIVPAAGDGLAKLLKSGSLRNLDRADFDALDEVKGLTAAQKDQAYVDYVLRNGENITNSADNIAIAKKLADDLRLSSANSPFKADGKLTDSVISGSKIIIKPDELGNTRIPTGFGKYETPTFQSPNGDFKAHFYYNPTTKKTFYDLDYKIKFNRPLEIQ